MISFIKRFTIFTTITLLLGYGIFHFLDYSFPLNLERSRNLSPLFLASDGQLLHCLKTQDDKWRLRVKFEDIDSSYIKWLLEKEDKNFYKHKGIDFKALLRAIKQNLTHQSIVSGASTITMQTARLLEPRPRSFRSKIIEAFRSLQLEYHFSKKEILEIYLNLVPFGGNLEGLRTASLAYFQKEPKKLLPSEIALFISLPQSPTRLRPDLFPEAALHKRNNTLLKFKENGLIEEGDYKAALLDPLPKRHSFPHIIPHLAYDLHLSQKDESIFKTTLDYSIQNRLNNLFKQIEKEIPQDANACALVCDHQKNTILSYVASTDFFNEKRKGQVDYIQSIRSPGSTLKPFIYGLAFDEGLISIDTLMKDQRTHFGAYAPYNFDRSFHGLMPAKETLQLSLNIPAVQLLNLVGPIHFYSSLKSVGVTLKFKDGGTSPNLSMALGGVGTSLYNLVMLYAGIANDGRVVVPKILEKDDRKNAKFLLYPSSANHLTKVLQKNPLSHLYDQSKRKIALKTGTSYGYRDALAIAYDENYTIGIWIGMPNGTTLGPKTGFDLAVPIIRQVFDILPIKNSPERHSSPFLKNFKLKSKHKEHVLISSKEINEPKIEITFPIHNSVIHPEKGQDHIPIQIRGGKKPYRFFLDGVLIQENVRQSIFFLPSSQSGFYRISVQDAKGESDFKDIEISPQN